MTSRIGTPLGVQLGSPHRLLFLAGAFALVAGMLWWALWLASAHLAFMALPAPPVPPGWAHATLLQYQTLPLFMFGFLMTGMPRWLDAPAFSARQFLPVSGGMFVGLLLTLAGLSVGEATFQIGLLVTLAVWTLGLALLAAMFIRQGRVDGHAFSVLLALSLGWIGLVAMIVWPWVGDWRLAYLSMKVGTFGLLLPVFFTVTHRVVPFFAGNALPGYRVFKPMWCLGVFWVLVLAHLLLELAHGYSFLWIVDGPLAVLTAWLWWRWQPWKARHNGLLAVLFIAWAWLPVAFALFALQSFWLHMTGEFVMLRAPVHALAVGYFSGLLVAMVTRVTQGHSGRPLVMGVMPWIAFGGIQLAAVLRLTADFVSDGALLVMASAVIWVVALLPWVVNSCIVYLSPRVDGKPG